MQDFRKLSVWKKSHELTMEIYKVTQGYPNNEIYGLTSQLRRAASAIPTNIAEGCGRDSQLELRRFAYISMGSASEVEYLLQLSNDLYILNEQEYTRLNTDLIEIKKMLFSFIRSLSESDDMTRHQKIR